MSTSASIEVAKNFISKTFSNKGLVLLFSVYFILLALASFNGLTAYQSHHDSIHSHQDIARSSWESNPDKHPHRMAHFGTFVFREQHPLRIFDSGLENYTGNSAFLEAHKQNSVNFSEASLSTGLLRFGDLTIAMILQFILPLIIFFIGYASISSEKENGTLKIMYTQGVSLQKIIFGKFLGVFAIAALFFVPALIALWMIPLLENTNGTADIIPRALLISSAYIAYGIILSGLAVLVSAKSGNSTRSLLTLLGAWLLLCVITPKSAQVIGNSIYPNLSKIEFKEAIEEEVSKRGDSHNPDDPYFNNLRDSLLQLYDVKDVKELPINYSGFVMSKGEEQTAKIYNDQHRELIASYQKQNSITKNISLLNPYLAIKNLSMGLSSTDFRNYAHFLDQIETFRYDQSQFLNNLQINLISNTAQSSEGKLHVVSNDYWKDMPDFQYEFVSVQSTIKSQWTSIVSLLTWLIICIVSIIQFKNPANII